MWRAASRSPLTTKIRAAHEPEFLFNAIAQPIVRLQTLDGNFFHLGNGVEMQLEVDAFPAVLAQTNDTFNRALLLLPARIRKSSGDRPFREVKQVGESDRHEVARETSEVPGARVDKWFHLAGDVDRVADCFHGSFLRCRIVFVKIDRSVSQLGMRYSRPT